MLRGYHSLPKAGREYSPQWTKMPNLPSRYHAGASWRSSEGQSAANGPAATAVSTVFRMACAFASLAAASPGASAATASAAAHAEDGRLPGAHRVILP